MTGQRFQILIRNSCENRQSLHVNQCLSGVMLRSSASGLLHAAVHWNALGRAEEQCNGRGGLGSNYLEAVAGILNHPEPWTLNPKFKTPYKPHAESQWVPETFLAQQRDALSL